MTRFGAAIFCTAVDQEYAKGLSEWQHEVICKSVRRIRRVDRKSASSLVNKIRHVSLYWDRKTQKLKAVRNYKWMALKTLLKPKLFITQKRRKFEIQENSITTLSAKGLKAGNDGNNFIRPMNLSSSIGLKTKVKAIYTGF